MNKTTNYFLAALLVSCLLTACLNDLEPFCAYSDTCQISPRTIHEHLIGHTATPTAFCQQSPCSDMDNSTINGLLWAGNPDNYFDALFFNTDDITSPNVHDDVKQNSQNLANLSPIYPFHAAAKTPQGDVLLMGGVSSPLDSEMNWQTITRSKLVTKFDFATASLYATEPLQQERAGHTATFIPHLTQPYWIIIGGNAQHSMETYPDSVWNNAVALTENRQLHTATPLDEGQQTTTVLIAGGFMMTDNRVTKKVEVYQSNTNTVYSIDELYEERVFHTATYLPWLKQIWLIGGENEGGHALSSIEMFSSDGGIITKIDSTRAILTPRKYHTTTPLPEQNALVIIGGRDSNIVLSSMEIYKNNRFYELPCALTTPRYGHTANLVPSSDPTEAHIVVAGGYNNLGELAAEVEIITINLVCLFEK